MLWSPSQGPQLSLWCFCCAVHRGDQFEGGVGVGDVVVAQFLALQLAGVGDAGPRQAAGVEGRRLVRVLAVAHGLDQGPGDGLARRRAVDDEREGAAA